MHHARLAQIGALVEEITRVLKQRESLYAPIWHIAVSKVVVGFALWIRYVHVVLLEATGKKVKFLQHIFETLQLKDVVAVNGRAEELAHKAEYRASFDVVTARAVASLPALLEYAAPFCRLGGK